MPTQLGIIPLYLLMVKPEWTGTLYALVVPALVNAFGVFFMTRFLSRALPTELLEAGRVDGCTTWGLYWHVVLPVARPAAAVLGMLTFMAATGGEGVAFVDPGEPTTAMGRPIAPDGLTRLLVRLSRDYPQVGLLVTENGAAFDDVVADGRVHDAERVAYLDAHLRAAHAAIAAGADLRGYLVWSLLDNFEWAEGYRKRFGIVHVDYATQRRLPKNSALWYRGVIERNGLV
ncbi:family 1 glycosylhydrolase [Sphaerisporangium fuscum]|uniref:family 1 glycosylhydrolase n=1 Tax=Sphaerisporangium fuscum TaxID=2835868 RepID=UPI00355702B0